MAQEYYGRQKGTGWEIRVKSFQPPTPRPTETAPLYGDAEVAREYRLLAGDANFGANR